MSKKVVIIIVEGDSDEILLIDRLKELYTNYEIRFESQRGDILYKEKSRKSIKSEVGDVVKSIITKRKYKTNDILAVLHIMDTDGCFIKNENIIIDKEQKQKTLYKLNSINVSSEKQKENIEKRNKQRSINVATLNSIESVVGNKYKYQLYYFSRNLEHVVFNEPNPENEFKYDNIEKFVEELKLNIEVFLKKYLPNIESLEYENQYRESWVHIANELNSLNRMTNVPLLFDFINKEIKK